MLEPGLQLSKCLHCFKILGKFHTVWKMFCNIVKRPSVCKQIRLQLTVYQLINAVIQNNTAMIAKLAVCYIRKLIIIQLSVQKVPFVSSFVSMVKKKILCFKLVYLLFIFLVSIEEYPIDPLLWGRHNSDFFFFLKQCYVPGHV